MRRIFYLVVLCGAGLWAQEKSAPPSLAWSNALSQAEQVLQDEHEQQPEEQRAELNSRTSQDRSKLGFWLAAIELELQEGNPQIALGLVHKTLKYHPSVLDLEQFRMELSQALHEGKTVGSLLKWSPNENEVKTEFRISTAAQSRLFTSFYDPQFQNSLSGIMNYEKGSIHLRANYAYRFEENALQLESDWYPKLNEKSYLYVNYGYSGTALFPTHRGGLEYFTNLPKAWEASVGGRFLSFADNNVPIYTASVGYYYGNYYSSFRGFFVPKKQGNPGISTSFRTRKYLKTAFQYLDLELGAGYDTDFQQQFLNGELATQTQLYIQQQFLSLGYNKWSPENKSGYRIDVRADHLELPFDPGKYSWSFTMGIQYQWGF
jgi:YaiO family outer membrane protein